MIRYKVDVTAELLSEAKASQQNTDTYCVVEDCLLARAISAATGYKVAVGYSLWRMLSSDNRVSISGLLPEVAQAARHNFDRRLKVTPFQFETIPDVIYVLVTQEMIDQAVANRNSPNFSSVSDCIAAVALKTMLPNEEIICGTTSVFINKFEYEVDRDAAEAIVRYMSRKPITPFALELKLVPEAVPCSH